MFHSFISDRGCLKDRPKTNICTLFYIENWRPGINYRHCTMCFNVRHGIPYAPCTKDYVSNTILRLSTSKCILTKFGQSSSCNPIPKLCICKCALMCSCSSRLYIKQASKQNCNYVHCVQPMKIPYSFNFLDDENSTFFHFLANTSNLKSVHRTIAFFIVHKIKITESFC